MRVRRDFRARFLAAAVALLVGAPSTHAGIFDSPIQRSYRATDHSEAVVLPVVGEPEIRDGTDNLKDDVARMVTDGYVLLGYSAYNGPASTKGAEVDQARRIGAQVIIYSSTYTGSETLGAIGSSSATALGVLALAVPITVDRYEQVCLFFARTQHHGLGFGGHFLTPTEAADAGTNKGVVAVAVVRGSPAFMADILPGDVIMSINGLPIYDKATYDAALAAGYGTTAKVSLLRKGQTLEKDVPLAADGNW